MKPNFVSAAFLCIGVLLLGIISHIYSDADVIFKSKGKPLPVLGTVPPFEFTDSTLKKFSHVDLDGKVTVLYFFFTSCPMTCPVITSNTQRVLSTLSDLNDLQMVGISVDPDTDTAERLAAFAIEHGVDSSRTHLLRGPIEGVRALAEQGLKLALGPDASMHTNRVVLIDKQGQIRATYLGLKESEMDVMVGAIKKLSASR